MNAWKWVVVLTFFLGFGWPWLWVLTLVAFEADRGGRDVVAVWLMGKFRD